jgi:hypothetical protein
VAGNGPYQFLLDTSAPASLVSPQLAAELKLAPSGARQQPVTVGCATTAQQVLMKSWSLGGVPLGGQALLSANVPGLGGATEPAGVIGSDILSRFGAIRIDPAAKQLTVLAPEAAPPSLASLLEGKAGAIPPPLLIRRTPKASVVLTVVRSNATALATTSASFRGRGPYRFVIDTGAAQSSVTPALAKSLGLVARGSVDNAAGAGCQGTVNQVQSGPWSLGSLRRPSALLLRDALAGSDLSGVSGRVSSDVLGSYGSIVLDYRTAVLWLGAG